MVFRTVRKESVLLVHLGAWALGLLGAGCEKRQATQQAKVEPTVRSRIQKMESPEKRILKGDEALGAKKYSEARDHYMKAADRWNKEGFYLKSLAVYKTAFELRMLDETTARKISVLYRVLGLDDEATTWAIWSRQIGSYEKSWIAKDANAHLGRLDLKEDRGDLRYAGKLIASVEVRPGAKVHVAIAENLTSLPHPILLGLLRNTLEFKRKRQEVPKDEDPFEPITVELDGSKQEFKLHKSGGFEAVTRVPASAQDAKSSTPQANQLAGQGEQLLNSGNQKGAIGKFQAALMIEPMHKRAIAGIASINRVKDVQTHVDLGNTYLEIGLMDEAADEFKKALKGNPNHKVAKAGLRKVQGK
jgi:tetratricopeptide (TPR) repeat protein